MATPEPSRVVGMDEQSPAGAEATAIYFLSLYPYAFATGDLTTWKEMSEDDCIFCNSVIEPFSPGLFVEADDDEGCGGDVGDGVRVEGDVLEGLEVLEHG
ncbi:DUF6318 family protein, partial [Actinomyces howellii]|uniref:DUF6318 family protein n=1 Tax=Actinomyces howellii TaxID=52771 RepID=UPI001F185DC3